MSRKLYPLREFQVGEVRVLQSKQKNFANYICGKGRELGYRFKTKATPEGRRVQRLA